MTKKVALLGSTGSIGRQSLDVIRHLGYEVSVLAANRNIDLLEKQIAEFHPAFVAVSNDTAAKQLELRISGMVNPPKLLAGDTASREVVLECEADIVLNAIVGIAGLESTLAALERGMTVALANKESLVAGGEIVMRAVREHGGQIVPVDSEHSAIFQCLQDPNSAKAVRKIHLTASGGPFYGFTRDQLSRVSARDAMQHPNWDMGPKITIDSATLMNKGLELIEAMWMFDTSAEDINIVVQSESIIHSMVEFTDFSVLAQIGMPDMRVPIQYALTWPRRLPGMTTPIDFTRIATLDFGEPDTDTFQCLDACIKAAKRGGLAPCAVNCANEEAVQLFMRDEIGFLDIGRLVNACLEADSYAAESYTLADVKECDEMARRFVQGHL